VQADLLALDLARVARHHAHRPERRLEAGVELDERAREDLFRLKKVKKKIERKKAAQQM